MKFWVGITDNDWFKFLSERAPDEVNFWQPSARTFRVLEPGELFLFKLHAPYNYIVGGGFFVRHSVVPISLAWEAFGEKNGTNTLESLRSMITRYRGASEPDPVIGCIILAEPFFFERDEWVAVALNDWRGIQIGRTFDTSTYSGSQLWAQIEERLSGYKMREIGAAEDTPSYGYEYLVRARLGQGAFRILVTEAYNRQCAITGERTLPVLESAHIKPFAQSGPNKVSNGLLLRSDLHKLFDIGYLTITDDLHIEVSKRIEEEYHNGREYYKLHGNKLRNVPIDENERPSSEFIEWHNQNIYVS